MKKYSNYGDESNSEVRILINPTALAKIKYWVDVCPVEISGLGSVVELGNNTYYVDEVFLQEQENTAADTEIS